MKKFFSAILVVALSMLLLVSCPPSPQDPLVPQGDLYLITPEGVQTNAVSIDDGGNVKVNLGDKSGNLYLVISNLNNSDTFDSPSVSAPTLTGLSSPISSKSLSALANQNSALPEVSMIRDYVERVVEVPISLDENRGVVNGTKAVEDVTKWTSAYTNLTEGETHAFYNGSEQIEATLRKKVEKDDKTLFVFVANDQFGDNGAKIDQAFVNDQADAFLPSNEKGIWELDEDVFGKVYGDIPGWEDAFTTVLCYDRISNSNGEQIDNTNEVVILFFDINKTGSTTSGVAGFFGNLHTKVNTKNGMVGSTFGSKSNEAVMLFMDSYLSKADPSGSKTTMAHEFQHAIHNYQRNLKKGWISEGGYPKLVGPAESTFVTELFATLAEEMVANKLGVSGPGNNDETTGGTPSSRDKLVNGRMAQYLMAERYNLLDYAGVQGASPYSSVFPYGLNFSFGAYLVRNYGTDFIKKYFDSNEKETNRVETDTFIYDVENFDAITSMLAKSISDTITWEDLMRGWGASVLLSDVSETKRPYKMLTENSENDFWFNNTFYNGNKIASANHYGFEANVDILGSTHGRGTPVVTNGPLIYNSASDRAYSLIQGKKLHPNTNTFVLLKAGATGTYDGLKIENSNSNLRYTFVLK